MPSPRDRGRPPQPDVLTPGEWRVVEAVRHGLGNREIAARQGVSLDAVKYHVAKALHKLGLSSRAQLRRWNGVRRDSRLHDQERILEQDIRSARSARSPAPSTTSPRRAPGTATCWGCRPCTRSATRVLRLRRPAAVPVAGRADPGRIHPLLRGRRHPCRARRPRRPLHARAAPDPSPRERAGGVDGLLRGQRRPAAGDHVARRMSGARPLRRVGKRLRRAIP